MPISKTKDENFFKKWSTDMAYILGFFCADGSMLINPRGSCYIEFENTEPGLLEKFRNCLSSNHKISKNTKHKNWKPFYRMQIGSKEIFSDLLRLGVTLRKKTRLQLPKIPNLYFPILSEDILTAMVMFGAVINTKTIERRQQEYY